MKSKEISNIFTQDRLQQLFPEDRTDQFFDALYGDAAEGTYDISLKFKRHRPNRLEFELHLLQRHGKCLHCSLTYGLPQVFARHPAIDINGLIGNINQLLNGRAQCIDWQFGSTLEKSDELHAIPLTILLES